ncbi:MAG: cyclase family protein [Armatimonadota bacterium]|nr:cyclase family protein [Armatimonadota bacterium]
MRIIDLTHTIADGMPVFSGDPEVRIETLPPAGNEGYVVSKILLGTHTGTHVDAPCHLLCGSLGVDQLALDSLVGWAQVLDLPKSKESEIDVSDLVAFGQRISEGSRLLLRTGRGKYFGRPQFFSGFPGITAGAAEWLVSRGIKLLGLEQPSTHPTLHRRTHEILLSNGVVILESVANLCKLTENRVYLIVLPLKLAGADGAPARVVAIEGWSESNFHTHRH